MITQLYYETAAQIGYINPPPLKLRALPDGIVAQEIKSWRGKETALRNVQHHIAIDPDKIYVANMPAAYVIAHELTHTLAHSIVGGGGATEDGDRQHHGASFLAGWLVSLKRLGCSEDDVIGAAYYHQSMYQLSNEHTKLAIKSALETDDPRVAMNAAIIYVPMPSSEKILLSIVGIAFWTYLLSAVFRFWR